MATAKKIPSFHYENCVSCSICVQACPAGALDLTRKGKSGRYRNLFPELVNDSCIGCALFFLGHSVNNKSNAKP